MRMVRLDSSRTSSPRGGEPMGDSDPSIGISVCVCVCGVGEERVFLVICLMCMG